LHPAGNVGHIATTRGEVGACRRAAAARAADADDGGVFLQLVEARGKHWQGDQARPGHMAALKLLGLADIDQHNRLASVERGLQVAHRDRRNVRGLERSGLRNIGRSSFSVFSGSAIQQGLGH